MLRTVVDFFVPVVCIATYSRLKFAQMKDVASTGVPTCETNKYLYRLPLSSAHFLGQHRPFA